MFPEELYSEVFLGTLAATDAARQAQINGINQDVYYLREVAPAVGYIANDELILVDTTGELSVTVTIDNYQTRTLQIEKVAKEDHAVDKW